MPIGNKFQHQRYSADPPQAPYEKSAPMAPTVTDAEPQRAVTPGQFAAFYEGDLVCGSGIITEKDSTPEGNGP